MLLPNSAVSASRFILQRLEILEFPMNKKILFTWKIWQEAHMTRKNAMLDPNMRHLRDVNQGLWNRRFTEWNVLHPENWKLKIHKFQEPLPGLSGWIRNAFTSRHKRWRRSKMCLEMYSQSLKPVDGVPTPFFWTVKIRRTNCQNQNLASKVVFQNFF